MAFLTEVVRVLKNLSTKTCLFHAKKQPCASHFSLNTELLLLSILYVLDKLKTILIADSRFCFIKEVDKSIVSIPKYLLGAFRSIDLPNIAPRSTDISDIVVSVSYGSFIISLMLMCVQHFQHYQNL